MGKLLQGLDRAALLAGCLVFAASPARAQYHVRDAGQGRDFEMALDEVNVTAPDHKQHAEKISKRANAGELRRFAGDRKKLTGEDVDLVLYEKDRPHNLFTRRVVTRKVLVQIEDGADPASLAAGYEGPVKFARGYHLFSVADAGAALDLADQLRAMPGVLSAEPLLARQQSKRFTPNDTLFGQQWHLNNSGQNGGVAGIDVNITNVWDTYRGTNIFIAIVDDGLQTTHTDLSQNVNTTIDYDFNGQDGSPNPDVSADFHGTSCAGVCAGKGNNGRGISGAAPDAKIVGLRLIGGPATDLDEANAMLHSNSIISVKSNSWGPDDDGATLAGPGPLMAEALRSSATNGRAGKGTIFMWAAGNGDDANDNANYDGYGNSIYTIGIGGISDQGLKASYSEPGACVVVSAPTSSFNPDTQGITTTDLMGNNGYNYAGAPGELSDTNYTKTFGGTSSACPLAAGIVALVLQANTNLGWRDVQEILIRSARKIEAGSAEWINNGAGFHFNHNYGAGLIDAKAAVSTALTWTNLGAQTSFASVQSNLSLSIPDNVATGVTRTFSLSNVSIRVEQATLQADITHANRGDLEIFLISPNNTTSQLAELHGDTGNDYDHWTFMSVRDWGEQAAGTWKVKVADRRAANAGTLQSLRLEIFGTQSVSNGPPVLNAIGSRSVTTSNTLAFTISATDPDGDAITLSVSNKPAGSALTSTNGNGTFTWTNASPAGVYTARFYAVSTGGSDNESVVITVSNAPAGGSPANVWINEIHYDNSSTDIGEGFEVAGPAGTSLSAYSLIVYDGGAGGTYGSNALSGTIDNEGCGYGAVWFAVSGLQNGPDGVALVRNGTQVVQFLSYEGSFTASGGPAAGLTATDVGVKEAGTEAAGKSLQLRGTGTNVNQFAWAGPTNASVGSLNSGQNISSCSGQPPVLAAIGNKSVVVSNLLQIAVSATDVDGNAITLSVSNKPASATFGSTNGIGTFTWALPNPAGVYTCSFYAVDINGADFETIAITVSAPAGTGSIANVWINELHYDNTGTDANEGIEVGGAAGTSLTNYSVLFYDGAAGTVYKTTALSGSIDNEGCGYGAVWFAASALQNGAPDGLALVRNGTTVVQFLSYEGSFVASAGVAAGMTATDIGVLEAGTEALDRSVQLKGTGNAYSQFAWGGSTNNASRGTLNAGQVISGCGGGTTSVTPVVRFAVTNFYAEESSGAVNVPVVLSVAAPCTVRVTVAGTATSGSDFTLATNLVFTGSTTQQSFVVTISDDSAYEAAENIVLTLVNLANGTTGSAKRAEIDLRDNDAFSIMTANLSQQTNVCTSVYGDPAQRILRGLKPDIVAVQEFVVTNVGGYTAFVNANFGTNYQYAVEDESDPCGIPNGIVSRYPIIDSGEWPDSTVGYRDYVWATIDLPGPHNLDVVSVHLNQGDGPSARRIEAIEITNFIAQANFPPDDYVVICGDLNATNRTDTVLDILSGVGVDTHQPADQNGDKDSNSSRNEDFDYILPEPAVDTLTQPLTVNGVTFSNGMVFDSELWPTPPSPVLTNDSHAAGVQHMAVMKLFSFPSAGGESVWINEIHYDNTGTDTNEGVEVAGTAGTDLSSYALVMYGGTGTLNSPGTTNLSGTIDDEGCGFGAMNFPVILGNGPDGVALVHKQIGTTSVVQFLSYEGGITAVVGAASGSISLNIGVSEPTSLALGKSLQLVGTGNSYAQFTWTTNTASTGTLNVGQSIVPCSIESPPVWQQIGNKSANVGDAIQFSVSAFQTDGDTVTLSISNKPGAATFGSTNGNGTFTWNPATPAGVYTTRFYAADNDGVTSQTVVLHVLNPPAGGIGTIWINEIHYSNLGNDTNEGVEVAGKAGIVLTNYAVYSYDGQSQKVDGTNTLSGTIDYESCGYGAAWFEYPPNGLENDRAGLALVLHGTQVIQFISHDGSFLASNGPAAGLTSTDIGLSETNPAPVIGLSLQLIGSGTNFGNFSWTGPTANSTGSLSVGQSISPCAGDGPGPFGLPHIDGSPVGQPPVLNPIGNKFVVTDSDLYFDVTAEEEDGDAVTLSASNLPSGATFDSGNFAWIGATPAGVYTSTFYATDKDGADFETVTITVATWVPPPDALAYYNFDGSGAFTAGAYFVAANLAASGVGVGNGSLLDAPGNPNFAARGGGWTSATNYFEFSLVVSNGYAAFVNGFAFDDSTVAGGPPSWQLRLSADGFASNVAAGSTHSTFTPNAPGLATPILSGSNVFRLFGLNAVVGFWKIDNVLISGVVLPADQDNDKDGMPDIWEYSQFGDDVTANAASDDDEDGFEDWQEYRAGTNPHDDTSYLRFLDGTRSPDDGVIVRWSSESNKAYILQSGTQPGAPFDSIYTSPATPPINVFTAAPGTSAVQLFRIQLP